MSDNPQNSTVKVDFEQLRKAFETVSELPSVPARSDIDAAFLWPFLNQAITKNDFSKVCHYVELGAPVKGWSYIKKDSWFDDKMNRVEQEKPIYDDKMPAPLSVAAEFADMDIIRYLIEKGAVTGHNKMPDQHNPSLIAIRHDRYDVLAELLKHGVCLSYDEKDDDQDTAFVWRAVKHHSPKTLRLLMNIEPFAKEAYKNRYGVPITIYAVRWSEKDPRKALQSIKDTLSVLFEFGISPNAVDREGETLLHNVASRWGNEWHLKDAFLEFSIWLANNGCDINIKNNQGELFYAKAFRHDTEAQQAFLSKLEAGRLSKNHQHEIARTGKPKAKSI